MTTLPEGLDITYKHMIDHEFPEPSNIQGFYSGLSILITGASGFVGSLLLEKLLRSCPGIVQIYVLIRSKRGKTPRQRMIDMTNDVVFERLKREQPTFLDKITIIPGDSATSDLGLSECHQNVLLDNVNCVFHLAATVKFDAPLRQAVNINVRGTRGVLQLARGMRHLKVFVHVSTAFSHCVLSDISERFYDVNLTSDQLITLTDILTDEQLTLITPQLLQNWPNTYAYTKAVSENMFRDIKGLPVAIVRPSIVIATKDEPISGWTINFYGVNGITTGAGLGILRTIHGNPDRVADIVPADYCVNAIIAAAWDTAKKNSNLNEVPIYNFVSSCEAPITWNEYVTLAMEQYKSSPSSLAIWYHCFRLNPNKYVNIFAMYLLHLFPAYIVDFICILHGEDSEMVKLYKKIHNSSACLSYFTTRQWRFTNGNVRQLWQQLNEFDQNLFNFNMELFCWESYMVTYVRGLRVYLLKDPLTTLPMGLRKYKQFRFAHYCLVTLLTSAILYIIWLIFINIFAL